MGLSANKVMATVFWDARSVIHIDYVQKGRAINGEHYTNLLDRFNEDLKKNDRIWPRKKLFFIKTMQEFIRVLFPWRNFTNYAINYSLIRRIRRI